jgi:alpha-D-xyloside xylohydrolase
MNRSSFALCFAILASSVACAQWVPLNPVKSAEKTGDGVVFRMQTGLMKIQVCSDSIIRVMYAATDFPNRPRYAVIKDHWPVQWNLQSETPDVVIATAKLTVKIARSDGSIVFSDRAGKKLFQDNQRTLTPVEVNGQKTYRAEMFSNLWGSYEAFYGLGQHQAGVWNYRGEAVDLSQDNTNISVPMFLSSNGYGIFWDNTSRSRFNNRFLSALYVNSEVADMVDYYFLYGPEFDQIIADYRNLTGAPPLFGKWAYGFWQCKNRYMTQREILDVARKYRELHIPIDNIVQDWFWWKTMGEPVFDESRYPNPQAMIDRLHADHFHLMISVWPYFRPGSETYSEMQRRGYFIDKTKVAGFHPEGQALYDAFSPAARTYYWKLIDDGLFKLGVDAWWLDTDEPETEGRETNVLVTNKVNGDENGAVFANLYPLMTTSGVYEGQRHETDRKRVFILSRSAFAGSQRNAAAVWSGDVNSDWTFFKRQIPAGLNYSLSGMAYWTTDIGGFVSGNPNDPKYRELFIRWFQFGTFCPIFRVHGTRSNDENELWSYGPEAQKTLVAFDRLRYRLLPYIYSVAWMTTNQDYTPMRALAMDFRSDTRAANIEDQFMFGPAVMVNPVTDPEALGRRVYLPPLSSQNSAAGWYDFWTGKSQVRTGEIEAAAPIDRLPLYVRAGSILPLGPDQEWSTEKPADPIELRIYPGANGDFSLYEDEGDNYDYEKGAYATIPLHWDEGQNTLTIGTRKGSFPGMLRSRTFRLVFVRENHGAGTELTDNADRLITYDGKELRITRE